MIESFEVNSYKCFSDLKIENLSQINIISGGNNVGKTALLELLYLIDSSDNLKVFIATLQNIFKNQLTFAPGITAVNDHVHIPTANQFAQGIILTLGIGQYGQGKCFRQDGKIIQGPFFKLRADVFRIGDGNQMTNGIGNNIFTAFIMRF